jgi:hypothetical protein
MCQKNLVITIRIRRQELNGNSYPKEQRLAHLPVSELVLVTEDCNPKSQGIGLDKAGAVYDPGCVSLF